MSFSREEARAKVLGYAAKRQKIETPWWPDFSITTDEGGNEVDNRLEVREFMGDESLDFDATAKVDMKKAIGQAVTKCLLLPGSSTPVLNETDFQAAVQQIGTSALMDIMATIQALSAKTPQAVADTQKK